MFEQAAEREAGPLIGPRDPPPYTVLNEGGTAKVLLVADHASNAIPEAMGEFGLDRGILARHVAYDIGTRKLVTHLARHLDAPAVVAGYSRLLVDLNRHIEDPTAFPTESDGILIPGNQDLSSEDRNLRVASFYTPYRQAIERMLARFRDRGIVPAFISIHSFTPELVGVKQP